jgi:hypothetical protein
LPATGFERNRIQKRVSLTAGSIFAAQGAAVRPEVAALIKMRWACPYRHPSL